MFSLNIKYFDIQTIYVYYTSDKADCQLFSPISLKFITSKKESYSCNPPFQTILHLTDLIITISALQIAVRTIPKSFRMPCINNLPLYQHDTGCKKQAPAKKISNEQHRCKHHKMSPVINSAVDTTAVLHNQ